MVAEEKHKTKLCLKSDYKKLITEFCQDFLGLNLTWNKRRNIKNISYRPNHVDGRRSDGRSTQVATEGRPLGPGGPRILLTHLHIVMLKQQGEYLKRMIKKKNLKRKEIINTKTLKESSVT